MIAPTIPSTRRATPAGSITQDQCAELQARIANLPKRDALPVIQATMPHLSKSWINRNFAYIVELEPDALSVVISYADPTGNAAVRNVMRGDR